MCIDVTKPVKTKDGKTVTNLRKHAGSGTYVLRGDIGFASLAWTATGQYWAGSINDNDIENVPEIKKIDWTKPIRTIKGKTPVTMLSTQARGDSPFIGYVGDGNWIERWYEKGNYRVDGVAHKLDIENTPEQATIYLNIYKHNGGNFKMVCAHNTKEEAESMSGYNRSGCVKITLNDLNRFDD